MVGRVTGQMRPESRGSFPPVLSGETNFANQLWIKMERGILTSYNNLSQKYDKLNQEEKEIKLGE